jgi:hypothetical protein
MIDEALSENLSWDPPDEPQEAPTEEQRGVAAATAMPEEER